VTRRSFIGLSRFNGFMRKPLKRLWSATTCRRFCYMDSEDLMPAFRFVT
jgi:hypothetical protein